MHSFSSCPYPQSEDEASVLSPFEVSNQIPIATSSNCGHFTLSNQSQYVLSEHLSGTTYIITCDIQTAPPAARKRGMKR